MIGFVILSVMGVVIFKFINFPATPIMVIRIVEGAFDGKMVGIEKDWESWENISKNFYRAVVAAEDARFMQHNGIDWKAVEAAQKYNERHKGKKKRGASTITMQTAKMPSSGTEGTISEKGSKLILQYSSKLFGERKGY
jgi:monofunctional biosynthetic peptidoglycan transglycosylase